ncbi:hypothetical protein GmHk_U059488 [Glycine max]|nr:hypothetical protein GmHk_U059488 [Glycine max]
MVQLSAHRCAKPKIFTKASRKRKAPSTPTQARFDRSRFTSHVAWERCTDIVVPRKLLPERKVDEELTDFVDDNIDVAIVKEFYANLYDPEDKSPKQVRVRDSRSLESLSVAIKLAYIKKNYWNLDDPTITFRGPRKARGKRSEAPSTSASEAPTPSSSTVPLSSSTQILVIPPAPTQIPLPAPLSAGDQPSSSGGGGASASQESETEEPPAPAKEQTIPVQTPQPSPSSAPAPEETQTSALDLNEDQP